MRQHLTVQKQNGTAERVVRRIQKGTSAVLLQSGLDEKWWADSIWSAIAICEACKISCPMGKHLMNGDSENQLKASNSVWFDGRLSPYLCGRLVATASVRQESLARNLPRLCILRGSTFEIPGRRWNSQIIWRRSGS